MRKIKFENDKYYHIYNRGVDKREIFLDEKDFVRFIISMREFNVVEPIGSLYDDYLRKKRETCGNPISNLEIVDSAKYLVWASAYVNGNVEIHKLVKAKDCQWSSYRDYLDLKWHAL